MNSEILVAAGGTVTIDTEEYRRLVEHNTCLNMILAAANDPKSYILSDITSLVNGLVKNGMMTTKDDESTAGGSDVMEVLRELHDKFSQEDAPAVEGRDEEAAHAE